MSGTSRTVWGWVGCGCAVIAAVLVLAVVGIAVIGFRTARTMSDPEARAERTLAVLDAASIPEGYETQLVMDVPLMADLVVLRGDRRQLVFLSGLRTAADIDAAFESDEGLDAALAAAGVTIDRSRSVVDRGRETSGEAVVRWAMVDGPIGYDLDRRSGGSSIFDFDLADLDLPESMAGETQIGVAFFVRCSGREPGLGVHVGPRLDPGGDPGPERAAFAAFVDEFGFCR